MAIYKDKKRGTYYFSVLAGGKRHLRRGFKTRKEARDAEVDFLYNFDVVDEDNIKFKELADMYLKWYEKRRKESSYAKIESVVNIHLNPIFENKYIKDINKRDIVKMHNTMLDKLSVGSTKKVHTVLSAMLNHAIDMDYLKENVAREVGNVDIKEEKKINFWTVDEFMDFISHVDDPMYKTLFMTLFYGGLRKGEALALKWKDVDFDNNTINIDKTVYQRKITPPKNQSSIRKIKMPQHTMTLLSELRLQSKINYVVFGEFYDHVPETTIDRYYNYYIKQSKVNRIRIHDFRHSHASYLISMGNDIQIVSKRLGHANTSTTYDIYAHLYPNAEEDAIAKMEDDFKPADVINISDFR